MIIPSLNAAAHIRQCLDSVRIQTLSGLEILCVDAGSTDGTIDILKEYASLDNRIHHIPSGRKSYGYQMNLGMDAAKGEYIGIVEPDDLITDEMFERLYDTAHSARLDLVKSDFYKFVDHRGRRHYQKWERSYWGRPDDVYDKVILPKETPQALVYGDHGNIWSGIYRSGFLHDRKIRFHETPGASYQDTGFALLCTLEAERVMFLRDCLYRYRQGGAGASVRSQDKHSAIIIEYTWIWEQMERRGFTDEISRSFYMAMKFHSYLWNCNRLQAEGRRHFLEDLAKDEMLDFDEDLIGFQIPEKDRMLRAWRGEWQASELCDEAKERKRKNMEVLLLISEKAPQIIVISAGRAGALLMEMYEELGAGDICVLCADPSVVPGRSAPGAFRIHPDAYYLIADVHQAQGYYDRLVQSGIAPERIYICREKVYTGKALIRFLMAR